MTEIDDFYRMGLNYADADEEATYTIELTNKTEGKIYELQGVKGIYLKDFSMRVNKYTGDIETCISPEDSRSVIILVRDIVGGERV